MKKNHVIYKALSILCLLAFALAACAPAATPTAASEAPSGVTLTVWYNSADAKPFVDIFQRWADKTGNKVNLVAIPADGFENTVQTRWAAGERPDIMEYHATGLLLALNPAQNMQDLSGMDFAKKTTVKLYPALASQNGKIYGAITVFPGSFGILYNKKVLADAGVNPPQSFADLEAACANLKEKAPDVIPIWESGGSSWPTQILSGMYMAEYNADDSYAQSVLTKKTTLDDPNGPFVAALTEYKKLLDSGCFNKDITTAKFEDSIKAVADGKAAMVALANGFVSNFNDALGGDTAKTDSMIGFATPSATKTVAAWGPGPTGTYYAPKTGDPAREAAALDFIGYATGTGYQQTVNDSKNFPILSGFQDPSGLQPILVQSKQAVENGGTLAFNTNLVGMNAQFDKLIGTIISGQATPLEAAKQAQLQLEQGATAQKLPGW